MFRKIIFIIVVLSPVLYTLFIGYPVISDAEYQVRQAERPDVVASRRCFHVGDFPEFRQCFARHDKLAGRDFAEEVTAKTNRISPVVTYALVVGFFVFILLSVSVLLA